MTRSIPLLVSFANTILMLSYHIHRSGDENMLKMRFRTSSIATATKIKSSHALRNSSLNPSSLVISLLGFFGRLLLSCRLNRFVLFLSPKDYLTRIGCRMSTLRTKWTGQTIGFAKLSTNHFKMLKIFSWCPFAAFACHVPFRATGPTSSMSYCFLLFTICSPSTYPASIKCSDGSNCFYSNSS